MARHNQEARGVDQRGQMWKISFQPDWLSRLKISRKLGGERRRSSLTVFRNPARRAESKPGKIIKTGLRALDGSAEFRISVEDPMEMIESITVVAKKKRGRRTEEIRFKLEARMPPPRG